MRRRAGLEERVQGRPEHHAPSQVPIARSGAQRLPTGRRRHVRRQVHVDQGLPLQAARLCRRRWQEPGIAERVTRQRAVRQIGQHVECQAAQEKQPICRQRPELPAIIDPAEWPQRQHDGPVDAFQRRGERVLVDDHRSQVAQRARLGLEDYLMRDQPEIRAMLPLAEVGAVLAMRADRAGPLSDVQLQRLHLPHQVQVAAHGLTRRIGVVGPPSAPDAAAEACGLDLRQLLETLRLFRAQYVGRHGHRHGALVAALP